MKPLLQKYNEANEKLSKLIAQEKTLLEANSQGVMAQRWRYKFQVFPFFSQNM